MNDGTRFEIYKRYFDRVDIAGWPSRYGVAVSIEFFGTAFYAVSGEFRMELRRATPDDAESLLRFWADSGASISTTDEAGYIARAIAHPAAALVIAEIDGRIVGSLLGTFDGWRGNMYRLVVAPDVRRRGIGRMLVREVEKIFAAWGVRRTTVLIEVDRPGALAFWTAVGYPHDGHVVRHVGAYR